MPRIVAKDWLAPKVARLEVEAPEVARASRPGQFVIVRAHEKGERIPLTIVDSDPRAGTIVLVCQEVGKTTALLCRKGEGEEIPDLVGPLGRPTEVRKFGKVACVAGGVGCACVLPVAKALKREGNKVVGVVGARTRALLILLDELREVCDELHVSTDDGSLGFKGLVSDLLRRMLERGEGFDLVYASGPAEMMKAVCEVTRPWGIKTVVSLNPIMVDGTGMCGSCRVTVGGRTKFACVDGPEFDGHEVDFNELLSRLAFYREEERVALEALEGGGLKPQEEGRQVAVGRRLRAEVKEIPRQRMPEREPEERVRDFDEVALGFSEEQALLEARRCLQCKEPPCVKGCPAEVDIPGFISLVREGDFLGALRRIREKNNLPGICGRVCPFEEQCEARCVLGRRGEPVAIASLERFVADFEAEQGMFELPKVGRETGHKVAVVGSGPAGLTVAGDLSRLGHKVVVFESLHEPGGVLTYGIPEFRLPKRVVKREVEYLRRLGVE